MFDFRLINTVDGNQIIDTTSKTPYETLTPIQMVEYIEVDNQLFVMELLGRKNKKAQSKREFIQKFISNCKAFMIRR